MNILNIVRQLVDSAVAALQKSGAIAADIDAAGIVTEIPPQSDFGHFATNAAMHAAKQMKTNPRAVADIIAAELKKSDIVADVNIAGPGFINIVIANAVWDKLGQFVLDAGANYGESDFGANEKINVEFLSANPTGPMHVGHCRGAILGNAIAQLLSKIGYAVTREYYVNDFGNQVDTLADSVHWRYEQLFGLHENDAMPDGWYPGDYILPVAKKIRDTFGDKFIGSPRDAWLDEFKKIATADMMDLIRGDLASLGIFFDVFMSERELVESGAVAAAVEQMNKMGLLYQGALPKPAKYAEQDDNADDDWVPVIQTLFRAGDFGDTSDRVFLRADGSGTYFTSDVAYHYNKFTRGFNKMIDVWGADHGGYVPRIRAAVSAITDGRAELDIVLNQIVNLLKDGQPFRMSKRAGNFVLVSDVLSEIDADVLKIFMLSRTAETQMSFDLSGVAEQSKDNPIYYIQYAMGRLNSVLANYESTFGAAFAGMKIDGDFYGHLNAAEQDIIREAAQFPNVLHAAAIKHAPNLVVAYLEKLSQKFHSAWTVGAKSGEKFIQPDNRAATDNKMLMVSIVRNTIQSGLSALGIRALNRLG